MTIKTKPKIKTTGASDSPATTKLTKRPGEHKAPKAKDLCFTLQRPRGKDYSYTELPAERLLALLAEGSHHSAVAELRRSLLLSRGSLADHTEAARVGRVITSCFARKQKGRLVAKRFNGVVALDVQNVYSPEELQRLKRVAALLPMTLAAFVGSSGMSLKILVRYWPEDGVLPRSWHEVEALHTAAYRQAKTIYTPLLGRPVAEKEGNLMYESFLLSIDPEPLWRPAAVPMTVAVDLPAVPFVAEPSQVPPADTRHYYYYSSRFAEAHARVIDRFREERRDESLERQAFIEALTAECFAMQIPLAEARERIVADEPVEEQVRWTNYVNDYYTSHSEDAAAVDKTAAGVREMERLLLAGYEFYRNEIDGATYYRARTTSGRWAPLDRAKQSGMELEALEAGTVKSTKIVRTFLDSDRIPMRNPLNEYISSVKGRSDGHDYIADVARCVCQGNPLWERVFHIWTLAMVQQWMGLDEMYGNALVPVLCGPQGTGKSTFCRSLLPDELRWGYLDHIDLAKRTELMRTMAQTLLINIDEFDQYRGDTQRGPLKNLVQQADVRTRQMYRSNLVIRQRLASFIATCNPTEVLVDETGSRRFFCVSVTEPIRLPENFDLRRFYAQAVDEIILRRNNPNLFAPDDITGRCYLTDAEREDVERSNSRFRVLSYAVERFTDFFEPVAERYKKGDHSTCELSRSNILEYLERHSERRFTQEDRRQLYAYLDQLVADERLSKQRKNKGYLYHVRRKNMPII